MSYVGHEEARLPEGDPIVTFSLVAASDFPEEPPIQPAVNRVEPPPRQVIATPPATVPKPVPAPPDLIVPKVEEIPAPEQNAIEPLPQTTEPPRDSSPPAAPVPVVPKIAIVAPARNLPGGDGSSLEPGQDATTTRAEIGVRAHPTYKKSPEPDYPLSARRRGQQGTVVLTVRVAANGHALEVKVKHSSGYASLDEAAIHAVHDWEFEPARVNARNVESDIGVPVQFRLSD